jgi:glycosyltransferase involved in cell wall biosynthesis
MRVLHLDTGLTMRGGQWQALLLARGLRNRGIEQTLLARGELLARLEAEGFEAAPVSWGAVRRLRATLVHAHDAHAHTWAALALRRPLVVSRRVAFPVKTGLLSRLKYARADLFLAVSRFVAGRLTEAGIAARRIRVVYDGAEPAPLRSLRPRTQILAPRFDDPKKGSVILSESGLDVKYSTDLIADLAGARVFVYLTREEGLGSAALLAQAAGVPVVASRVGGLPEIVVHEETGLLTENEPAAVRRAVERIVNDSDLHRRLALNALQRFEERFTVEHMVDATLAAYRELAG